MYRFLIVLLWFLMNCQSSDNAQTAMSKGEVLNFEEVNHFKLGLITTDFQLIDTQVKMDRVYRIIHNSIKGNRLPPIPTVTDEETYLVLCPTTKVSNDYQINKIVLYDNVLYVDLLPTDNEEFREGANTYNGVDILLKVKGKVTPSSAVFIYN